MAQNTDMKHIPCYKVVNSNGMVGAYSGAGRIKTKIKLLKKDGIEVVNGKVNLKKYEQKLKLKINLLFKERLQDVSPELLNNILNGIKLSGYLKLK